MTSERPLIFEMQDARKELAEVVNKAVNERKIPCFIYKSIIKEILTQVEDIERQEYAAAEKALQNSKTEEQ